MHGVVYAWRTELTERRCDVFVLTMSVQDVHAYYYTYKYIRDEDEAMSYWVEHDRHSTVLDSDYRKAIVSLLKHLHVHGSVV